MLLPPRYLLRDKARFFNVNRPRSPLQPAMNIEDAQGIDKTEEAIVIWTRQMWTSLGSSMLHDYYDSCLTFACLKARRVCVQGSLTTIVSLALALGVLGCGPASAAPASSWSYSAG